jgi:hypothetical protein
MNESAKATFRAALFQRVRHLPLVAIAAIVACNSSSEPAAPKEPSPVVTAPAMTAASRPRWNELLDEAPALADRKFYFVMAASAIDQGGLTDVDKQYSAAYSRTLRVGIAVPVLYLRTTLGASKDWTFDPDFSTQHRCKDRAVAEDSLNGVIRFAVDHQMPVRFILNGGVWANSSCNAPEWDIVDKLEENVANCQWSQSNVVFPRDYLKNLAGSIESPELARSLTYNVYASRVRGYKKRNLQAAARSIAAFAREHPDLFIGVNLDADTYMNPFFDQKEWFDYNPGTIRQFRQWLRGTGPYAGRREGGAPDLSAYRLASPLSLADVNRLSGKHWTSWDSVDPPRTFPGTPHDALTPGQRLVWDDPWYQVWDAFRKHLIGLHYSELSQWVHEAGISTDKIYSAQGFMAPGPMLHPFAVRLDSHGQNYDSAGASIEGAIPRFGHLGAILYGEAAENRARMEVPHSLLATFSRMDPGWAVVEFNSTDLRQPTVLPTYAQAYRSFRDFFNFDATQITAMAWNGSDGANAGQKGYLAYTAWRHTPMEDAMRDFLESHADIPRGARVWTFGTARLADDDGWSAENGRVVAGNGVLDIALGSGTTTLVSPPDQVIRTNTISALVLGAQDSGSDAQIRVLAHSDEDPDWREIVQKRSLSELRTNTGVLRIPIVWPAEWLTRHAIADQLRMEITGNGGMRDLRINSLVLYPNAVTH